MERPFYHRRPIIDPEALTMYLITDPAIDAAVLAAVVDNYEGVLITTTTTGNSQTIASPTDTATVRRFTVINNDTSTDNIPVNTFSLGPGESQTWIWDGTAWIAPAVWAGAMNTTVLSVTAERAAGADFSVVANVTGCTKSGDDGFLLASAAAFNGAEYIFVLLNGVRLVKSTEAIWRTAVTFDINIIVDNGDQLIILS